MPHYIAKTATLAAIVHFSIELLQISLGYSYIGVTHVIGDQFQRGRCRPESPLIPGRVAIVTGGSRGLGAEVVQLLLQADVEVVIACRKTKVGEELVEKIRNSGIRTGKTRVMHLDNASLDSVRQFADEFKEHYDKLHILVNNAGVMFTPYKETIDGFEEQYAINYLSHFLLTALLIPELKNAGTPDHKARIVHVSSSAHLIGDINFNDVNNKEEFLTGKAYAQSKLALLMSAKKLGRIFDESNLPIQINAAHPGVVNTQLFDNSVFRFFKPIMKFILKTPRQGAMPLFYAAVDPRLEGKSGRYIANCQESPVNPIADKEGLQDRLFDMSMHQVNLTSLLK